MDSKEFAKSRRKWPKVLLAVIAAIILIVAAYVLYVIISYERIEDREPLAINTPGTDSRQRVQISKEYSIISYNIGFGAYTPDFTFFMDGGKESVAKSKDSVLAATNGAARTIKSANPDFVIFEEVDLDSTRSHHVDQSELLSKALPNYYHNFAVNYDSAFLMVPPWKPIGKSLSGIATYSKLPVHSALRRSFPIATGFNKLVDLDRCYSVSRLPAKNGKELCIYSVHMSAYGHDASVREGQVKMLLDDMEKEYRSGNYVVCGGDFNHDMRNAKTDSASAESWAHPFPREALPDGFNIAMDQLSDKDRDAMPESTRNTDIPYDPEKSYLVTVDGFIISDNVKLTDFSVMDEQFRYSDHNPVQLKFELKKNRR